MTPAQAKENAALIAQLESSKRHRTPINSKEFLERLIAALKGKS